MGEIRGLIHEGIVGGILELAREYRKLSRGIRIFFVCVLGIAGATGFLGVGVSCFLENNVASAVIFGIVGILWLILFSVFFYRQCAGD